MSSRIVLTTVAALTVLAGTLSAAPLAYEDFESFAPGNFTSGGGWTVPGTPGVAISIVNNKDLSYSGGAVFIDAGNQALRFSSGSDSSVITGDTINAVAHTTFPSQTGPIYFSFLAELNDVVHNNNGVFMQTFLSDNNTIHSSGSMILFGGASGSQPGDMRARLTNSSGTRSEVTPSYSRDTTMFMVGRLSKSGAPGSNYDTFEMIVNPTSLTEPGSWTYVPSTFNTNTSSVDHLGIRLANTSGSELAWIDEIRIGTTFNSVVVPEPGTGIMLILAGMALALFHRRRSR